MRVHGCMYTYILCLVFMSSSLKHERLERFVPLYSFNKLGSSPIQGLPTRSKKSSRGPVRGGLIVKINCLITKKKS